MMDDYLMEPGVVIKNAHGLAGSGSVRRGLVGVIRSALFRMKKSFVRLTKSQNPSYLSFQATAALVAVFSNEPLSTTEGEASHFIQTKQNINRITPEMCHITDNCGVEVEAVKTLDEAINFRQSDCIAEARAKLRDLFKLMSKLDARNFKTPTRYGLQVLERGKEILFENNVSCSVKHGTIILDSSNAQFYVSLLNIQGAFATEISEFQIAEEAFSVLIDFHLRLSDSASRRLDLGAAYNNRGCILLIRGEYKQTDSDFNNSLRHLNCEKRERLNGSAVDAMTIAVKSNISRLDLMSRHFSKGLEEQEKLVDSCKTKADELPFQTMFMVLQNKVALYTTLGIFTKAERELRWLISHCNRMMRRDEHDLLLNFLSLQLCEVLLHRGKLKEAAKIFNCEDVLSESVYELMPRFGELNFNVRMESFEKMIDVFIQSGQIKSACELVQKGLTVVENGFGPNDFNVASFLYKEGTILKLMGEMSSSLEKFNGSVNILRRIFGEKHPLLIECYMSLGDVAFRLGSAEESYLYFQRAMENVEGIHQVSFEDQLSMKYVKMTSVSKHIPFNGFQGLQEQVIEGLVAEHGQALALLVSRLHLKGRHALRKTRNKGKKPLVEKVFKVRHSESDMIISQKCVRDLLRTGQTLLRHGMTKEAFAFFQQASKHCQAYHVVQDHPNASLVRLYSIISQANLIKGNKLDKNRALNKCLEELMEDTAMKRIEDGPERSSKDTEKLTFDSQLTLKLALIFLILFSMHIKMHDTTFAAYDLYDKHFPNDEQLFLTLNDDLQVYASRTSVNCDGNTAVQDLLVSSAIGGNKTDSECQLSGKPLFRSLSYRNNVPTYSFLAISSAPNFLDVNDVKQLEENLLHSLQEYLQIKCLDNKGDVATRVVVDLTANSFWEQHILPTSSRIELLPLCLFLGAEEIHDEGRNISVIFPGLCEKITCMTFVDESTSCFMFGRIALWLLQQRKWGTMSTLRVQHQCLVLTVLHPVKARITVWYEDMSIKQKVQVISSAEEKHPSGWIGPRCPSCEDLMGSSRHCCKDIEQYFAPAIIHLANTHEVRCDTNVVRRQCSYSVEPQIVLDESCEPDGFHLNGLQPKNTFFQISLEENEKSVRKSLKVSTLECLTAISELSRQLYGDAVQEEDEISMHPNLTETDRMSSLPNEDTTSNPLDQNAKSCRLAEDTISINFSQPTFNHDSDPERRNLSKKTTEADRLTPKERDTNIKDNDDAIVFGRKQFEEERKSRIYSIAKLQEDLKKTGMWRKMTPLEGGDGSVNYRSEDNASSEGETTHGESYPRGSGESTVCGTQKAEEWGESDKKKDEHCKGRCEDCQVFKEKKNTGKPLIKKEEKEENDSKPSNDVEPQKALEEIQNETIATTMVNILPDTGATNLILNEASGFFGNETETGFSNRIQKHHEKANDIEMDSRETFQDEGVIVNNHKIESVPPKNNTSQSKCRKNHHATVEKDYKPKLQDGEEAFHHGPRAQSMTNFPIAELPMERNYPSFEVGVWNSGRRKEHDRRNGPNQNAAKKEEHEKQQLLHTIDVPYKDDVKKSIRSTFLGGDVVADGCTTDRILQRTQDVVDGPDSYHSEEEHNKDRSMFLAGSEVAADVCIRHASPQATQDGPALFHTDQVHSKDRMATSVQSPFLGGNVVADGYATGALPKTTPNGVNGSALTTENCLSGYSTMEGMGLNEGNAFKSKKSLDEVKRTNDLELIRNRGPSSFESEDVVDGPSKPPKDSKNVKCISPDFSGSKPTQRFHKTARKSSASTSFMNPMSTQQFKESPLGLDPNFVARHAVINSSPTSSFHNLTDNGATWEDPPEVAFDEQGACSNVHSSLSLNMFGKRSPWKSYKPYGSGFSANEAIAGGCSIQGSLHSRIIHQATSPRKDESWHFPPLPIHFSDVHECGTQQNSSEFNRPLFDFPKSRGAYNDLVSMTNEFYNRNNSYGEIPLYSAVGSQEVSLARSESQQNSTEDVSASLLARLKETMARTVSLIASIDASGKQAKPEQKPDEKVGIQEQASGEGETEHGAEVTEVNSTEQVTPLPRNEQTVDMEREDRTTPVQESPRPACGHYQRRCLVKFPCCGRFYPCHRCHNESKACSDDQARAINATHIRCTICYHEQLIDEGSRKCGGCNSKMSDYFCATCKHFTSVDKNPFHCEKCGICRIHSDKSFHCDVCNVCLDKRLQGKHKCRPDSGHDECCICLEDAFSGCQILPCSHKVHKDCAIAMIQNGVRTCPICRHPLFQQPEGTQ